MSWSRCSAGPCESGAPRGKPERILEMDVVGTRRLAGALTLLGVLAGACSDAGVRPKGSLEAADSADQLMLRMSTQLTEKGVLRSHVEADSAFIYQNTQ